MEKKSSKVLLVTVIVLSFLLIGLVFAGIMLYNMYMEKSDSGQVKDSYVSGTSIVIKDDGRDAVSELNDKVEDGRIAIRMTENWVFKNGGKESNAYIANSTRNKYDMRFEIILKDTNEVVMTSPDVPVGKCIENFPLSVTLKPGKYEVVIAHHQILDGKIYNTVRTSGTITVK